MRGEPMCAPPPFVPVLLAAAAAAAGAASPAQSFYRREPTRYGRSADDNAVTALGRELAAGARELPFEPGRGRLRALLRALDVPESSQVLVFSKTSQERHRVSPHNPRALYFGRDAYVAWIPGAKSLEVAAGDARLGVVFYRVPNTADEAPRVERDDSCLSCHASARTDDEPGLLLRSVFPDEAGDPIASAPDTDVTFTTPFEQRWGGWLVTGRFAGRHRGNGTARRDADDRFVLQGRTAADLSAFAADFPADTYLVPRSDVGALLALEQQVTVHDLLIRSALRLRHLLAADPAAAERSGEVLDGEGMRTATARVADELADRLVRALLLDGEPSLAGLDAAPDPAFARDFGALWPADPGGTRLGALDLTRRTFVLPLSPMVHSPAFRALPDALRGRVLRRLQRCLGSGEFPGAVSMTADERAMLRAHLAATVADWPDTDPKGR